jgi:hypothetical protein
LRRLCMTRTTKNSQLTPRGKRAAAAAAAPAAAKKKKTEFCDAFVFDTVGDASLLKLLGGSDQSHDAPACKDNSSGRVVVQPIAFEGLELDASCFRRTCLLELAALAGVKPQVIDMIMWRVAHLSHTL